MSYQRLYPQRINWEDEPSLATPINQVNLNKMDAAIYGIDGRVVELDENKVDKNETFNTARNGVVPKPTQADITREKVLRADGVWVEQSGGGGGGGGHTYVDKDDNQMPPRGKAKFTGGLNLTDDSENNTTKITDEYEIIPWTTWKGYTDAQKAQHPNAIVTGAPDCDGDVEIETMHLAWTNPNPTSAFAGQQITLDTDGNYDYVRIEFTLHTGGVYKFVDVPKNKSGVMDIAWKDITSPIQAANISRLFTISDGNKITFEDATNTEYSSSTPSNNIIIPQKVYTYTIDLTAKIKAIAHDVSTDASKCMLDENTSVQDMVTTDGLHNVDVPTGVTVSEHFNYFKIGKLVVVILGGVIPPSSTTGITIANNLPVMRSRPLAVVSNDSNSSLTTIVFGSVGLQQLYLSNPTGGIKYYGQVVYYTD